MSFRHELVATKPNTFSWDRDGLMMAMNDLCCAKRRNFVEAVEGDLFKSKDIWRNLWDETTVDPM